MNKRTVNVFKFLWGVVLVSVSVLLLIVSIVLVCVGISERIYVLTYSFLAVAVLCLIQIVRMRKFFAQIMPIKQAEQPAYYINSSEYYQQPYSNVDNVQFYTTGNAVHTEPTIYQNPVETQAPAHYQTFNDEMMYKKSECERLSAEISKLEEQINAKRSLLVDLDDEMLYQSFALYKPRYNLMNAEKYKIQILNLRAFQKTLIKNNQAVTGFANWTVNNSRTQGQKMVSDMQKLLLRAFNSECDEIINKVTFSNVELSDRRIRSSCENISKLGKMMGISISPSYEQCKIDELYLCYEYQMQKQKEKEEQKEIRAQMREEEKLRKEIEESRRKIEKDQQHFQKALINVLSQFENATDEQKKLLLLKKDELEDNLKSLEKSIADIDYREANAKAGYVYVISNIGAFGENVFKIGMTRRLDPMERIDELGDASVPFKFDVHAMIFTENAPALEAALHKAFEDRKLNMINQRREFFCVTLDEIKAVVNEYFDKTVEFIEIPPAQQYRESLKIREGI